MIEHFVLSDGTIEKYDYNGLVNKPYPVITDTENGHGTISFSTQSKIMDCVYSYLDNYNKMVYHGSINIENPWINSSGQYGVSCSSLVNLVLHGVRYETSAMRYPPATTVAEMESTEGTYLYKGSESGYKNGYWYAYNGTTLTEIGKAENTPYYDYAVYFDAEINDYMKIGTHPFSHELAEYLHDRGRLFLIQDDFSNLRFGDVMFLCNADDGDNTSNWDLVGHSSFFLGRGNRGEILVAEVSSPTSDTSWASAEAAPVFISTYEPTNSRIKTAKWAFRPPYNDVDSLDSINELLANGLQKEGVQPTSTDSTYVGITLSENLEARRLYSLAINLSFPNDYEISNTYIRIRGSNSGTSIFRHALTAPRQNEDGSYTYHFIGYVNDTKAGYTTTGLQFVRYDPGTNTSVPVGGGVTVNWVSVVKGVYVINRPLNEAEKNAIVKMSRFIDFTSSNITTQVDNFTRGHFWGYISSGNLSNSNVPHSSSYYVDVFKNSNNYSLIRLFDINGTYEYLKAKKNGTWESDWTQRQPTA